MQHSFVRFLLVGIINTLVGLSAMYVLLHGAGLGFWSATFLGNTIGAVVSYFLNKSFTFQSQQSITCTWYRFIIVIGICYLVAFFFGKRTVLWLMENVMDIPLFAINDVAILLGTCFYTILNYFGQRRFVFPK